MLTGREAYVIHPEGLEEFIYTGDQSCYQCNAEGYTEMNNIDKLTIKTLENIDELLKGKENKELLEQMVMKDITKKIKKNIIKDFNNKICKKAVDEFWKPKLD